MADQDVNAAGGAGGGGAKLQPIAKKAQEYAEEKDWKGYFGAVLGKPARDTLLEALAAFEKEGAPGFAIDLGCGEGRDTLELLQRGWRVLAIDLMPEAFEHMLARVPAGQRGLLRTQVATFEAAELPACDLLNSSFALPFCEPGAFEGVWRKVVRSIRSGGRFAGQLFGDRDDWVRCGDRCHFPRAQVEAMFDGFVFEHLREEEKDEVDGKGGKHWHVYHIVARKR
jgi:tellurite methyltransferase